MTTLNDRSSVSKRRFDLTVTLIAAGAALLGSLVGGGLSYLSTHQQIKAESSNSQRDFLRGQRQLAYSKLLSDDQIYSSMEQDEVVTLVGNRTGAQDLAKLNELEKMRSDLHKALQTDLASIELVSSATVVQAALALIDNHFSIMQALIVQGTCMLGETAKCSKARSEFDDGYSEQGVRRTLFVGQARADLSSS